MKHLLTYCFIILVCNSTLSAQSLSVEWTRFIGPDTSGAGIFDAIATRDGGIVFTGSAGPYCETGYGCSYNPDSGSGDIPPAPPYGATMVGKIDSNHNLLWVRMYNGNGGYKICQTEDGGYGVMAYTDNGLGEITGFHPGSADIWLFRIDSIGEFLYGNCFGSDDGDEEPFDFVETPDHGFVVLGVSNWYGQDVPYHLGGSEFEYDWFVVKTDSMLQKKWVADLGGSNDEFPAGSGAIIQTNNGYYLIGSTSSTDYDCTDTSWHYGEHTGDDCYILKLDSSGNMLYNKSFGGTGEEFVYNAILDPTDSSIVVTGSTTSNDYIFAGAIGEGFIIKIDKYGSLRWAKTFKGIGGWSVSLAPGIGYCVLGSIPHVIGGSDNYFLVFDTLGNVLADTVFGGTGDETPANAFSFNNGFIATGSSWSESFTQGENFGHRGAGPEVFISYIKEYPFSLVNSTKQDLNDLIIYPNPTTNTLEIKITKPGAIYILNQIGQVVYLEENIKATLQIGTVNWEKGLYFVQLQCTDGTIINSKLIVQ